MPANVDTMFSVREMPWHREGNILADYPGSWAKAREQAGLLWDPVAEPVYQLDGIDDQGQPVYKAIAGWNRIAHSGTNATLSINQDSYKLIDNGAMGEIVEAVLAQAKVKWETAGSLEGGRSVWTLAMLDEPIQLPGDDSATYPYLAITNRHTGTAAAKLRATMVRIVCANTFRAAELEGDRTGATFAFTHRGNWRDRIDQAREAVTGARKEIAEYRRLSEELLGIPITDGQRKLFVEQFIPAPPTGLTTDRVVRNIEAARKSLTDLFDSPTTAGIAHTGYGLVQAAGEYLDHVRRANTWETRLGRTLIRPEPLKARALSLVREITK